MDICPQARETKVNKESVVATNYKVFAQWRKLLIEKFAYWMGEDIFKNISDKKVNTQNIQKTYTTQHPKITWLKMRSKPEEIFPKKKSRWQTDTWKDAQHP